MYRAKLLRKLDRLDQELANFAEELKGQADDVLRQSPGKDVWSPMQLLSHLYNAEKLSLAYCKKKLSFQPKLKSKNFKTWVNDRAVSLALASPFKFKAPFEVKEEVSSAPDTLPSILSKWRSSRNDLRDFITNISEEYIDKEVYKHPLGMRLSLGGMLDFYLSHFRRHQKQLRRRLP